MGIYYAISNQKGMAAKADSTIHYPIGLNRKLLND